MSSAFTKLQFGDYSDVELQAILHNCMDKNYIGRMRVRGRKGGLYMRIIPLGRGRDREGLGSIMLLPGLRSVKQSGYKKGASQNKNQTTCFLQKGTVSTLTPTQFWRRTIPGRCFEF